MRHQIKKQQYAKSSKQNYEAQIAQQTDIVEKIRIIDEHVCRTLGIPSTTKKEIAASSCADPINNTWESKHTVAKDEKQFIDFAEFAHNYQKDPALTVCFLDVFVLQS